jgi:integrase
MHRLLNTTEAAPKRFNMTGHERGLVYRLALQAGLRAGEVKSLLKLSFGFSAKPATVHVEPSDTKGKHPADLVLIDETAEALRKFLNDKEPKDRAFAMPHKANTASMLKADLGDSKIEYTDASGRDCAFHALRHTFITNLALAGVHPAVAQELARHSSIELTMKYRTHVLHTSEVEAIDALRGLTYASQEDVQRRTTVGVHEQKSRDNGSQTRLSA